MSSSLVGPRFLGIGRYLNYAEHCSPQYGEQDVLISIGTSMISGVNGRDAPGGIAEIDLKVALSMGSNLCGFLSK